jgi:uncharacterized membrane protein
MLEGTTAASIRDKDSGLTRLEAFSDGVFAIAITLLVIEIHVPHVQAAPGSSLGSVLASTLLSQWPMYMAYVGTFVIIGIWWANHHELFEHFAASDHLLMLLNTLHLMCICFLPFATALVAEYVNKDHDAAQVGVSVYVGTLLLASVGYNLVWHYAARAGLLKPGLAASYLSRRHVLTLVGTGIYTAALALVFVNVWISLFICLAVALYYAQPGRRRVHGQDPRFENAGEPMARES